MKSATGGLCHTERVVQEKWPHAKSERQLDEYVMRPYPGKRPNRMKKLVTAISITQLLCVSMLFTSTSEVWARRAPPKIAPLKMEYYGHPEKNMVIEPSYESVGVSAVKVYLTRKQLSDKKVVWKTLLYTANYYLVSLLWCDKGNLYVCAEDERHENYYIDVETGRRIKRPW
jgi:hypothetical protein